MTQTLIYIIPIAIVLAVFAAGYVYSRKAAPKYAATTANGSTPPRHPSAPAIYEKPGVNQQSPHPLGAAQSVIHGRFRFVFYGLMLIGLALAGLYMTYFTAKMPPDMIDTPLKKLATTVLLTGAIVYGLTLATYATRRVTLRRAGFETSSILGTKSYEYKDADFYLRQTIEKKSNSDGYRPAIMKTQSYNWIWECQILFHDNRRPIILKSSRYACLKDNIHDLMNALGYNS